MYMGYSLSLKVCKDAENLSKIVVWGGRCASQKEH